MTRRKDRFLVEGGEKRLNMYVTGGSVVLLFVVLVGSYYGSMPKDTIPQIEGKTFRAFIGGKDAIIVIVTTTTRGMAYVITRTLYIPPTLTYNEFLRGNPWVLLLSIFLTALMVIGITMKEKKQEPSPKEEASKETAA